MRRFNVLPTGIEFVFVNIDCIIGAVPGYRFKPAPGNVGIIVVSIGGLRPNA